MDMAEQAGRLYLQGKNVNTISRELGVTRRQANEALEDFRGLLKRNSETAVDIRDRLLDILYEADESYRMVIEEAWETVSQADANGQLNPKVNALKLVESSTKNRAEALTKSGVSQDDDIINQLNDAQQKQEALIQLLKDIKKEYPEVAKVIAERLSKIQSEVEPIAIEQEGSYEQAPSE